MSVDEMPDPEEMRDAVDEVFADVAERAGAQQDEDLDCPNGLGCPPGTCPIRDGHGGGR